MDRYTSHMKFGLKVAGYSSNRQDKQNIVIAGTDALRIFYLRAIKGKDKGSDLRGLAKIRGTPSVILPSPHAFQAPSLYTRAAKLQGMVREERQIERAKTQSTYIFDMVASAKGVRQGGFKEPTIVVPNGTLRKHSLNIGGSLAWYEKYPHPEHAEI